MEWKAGDRAMLEIEDVNNRYALTRRADNEPQWVRLDALHPLPEAYLKAQAVLDAAVMLADDKMPIMRFYSIVDAYRATLPKPDPKKDLINAWEALKPHWRCLEEGVGEKITNLNKAIAAIKEST